MRELEHKRVQFVELSKEIPDKLSICSFGDPGTGKTELIASLPGPVGIIPLDRKTRPRISKLLDKYPGKKFFFPKEDLIRHARPMEVALMKPEAAISYYTEHTNKIKDAIFSFAERKDIASVGIDTGTQLWEDILFSHFGRAQRIMPRDRGPANQDIRDIMNSLQDKHLIITHQASEVWRNDKPTGKYEWSGFSRLDYYCNVVLEHRHDEKKDVFSLVVHLCQERPDLIGDTILEGDDINFDMLASVIYPDGNWE